MEELEVENEGEAMEVKLWDIAADSKTERIKAIVTIVVTAIVNIVNLWGYSVDLDAAISTVLTILSAITWVWCWWKNQNVTPEAAKAQVVLDALKEKKRVDEKAEEPLE